MRQLCPCSPREEQRSTCSPQRSMVGQISSWGLWRIQSRGIPKGGCDPGGSLHRSRLLAELVTPEIALHALCVLLADQSHFCAVSTVCPITRRAAADTTNITGKTKVSCHDCFSTSNTGYSVTVWLPIACHHWSIKVSFLLTSFQLWNSYFKVRWLKWFTWQKPLLQTTPSLLQKENQNNFFFFNQVHFLLP